MVRRVGALYAGAALVPCLLAGAGWQPWRFQSRAVAPVEGPAELEIQEPVQPVPVQVDLDARKVALGQRLFHEPLLSRDGKIACGSCHHLEAGGADTRAHSL